jgi:hypothetical protein
MVTDYYYLHHHHHHHYYSPPPAEVKTEFARIEPLLGLPYIHHKKRGHFSLIEHKQVGISEK